MVRFKVPSMSVLSNTWRAPSGTTYRFNKENFNGDEVANERDIEFFDIKGFEREKREDAEKRRKKVEEDRERIKKERAEMAAFETRQPINTPEGLLKGNKVADTPIEPKPKEKPKEPSEKDPEKEDQKQDKKDKEKLKDKSKPKDKKKEKPVKKTGKKK